MHSCFKAGMGLAFAAGLAGMLAAIEPGGNAFAAPESSVTAPSASAASTSSVASPSGLSGAATESPAPAIPTAIGNYPGEPQQQPEQPLIPLTGPVGPSPGTIGAPPYGPMEPTKEDPPVPDSQRQAEEELLKEYLKTMALGLIGEAELELLLPRKALQVYKAADKANDIVETETKFKELSEEVISWWEDYWSVSNFRPPPGFIVPPSQLQRSPQLPGGTGGPGSSCPPGLGGGPSNPCGACPNGNCLSPSAKPAARKSAVASLPNKDRGTDRPAKSATPENEHGRKSAARSEPEHERKSASRGEGRGVSRPAPISRTRVGNLNPGGGIHPGGMGGGGLGGLHAGGMGGFHSGGMGGFHAGGFGGFRRSDIRLKQDIVLLGRLANGLELYRYRYIGEDQVYVGVMAQQVRAIAPEAVAPGSDGYLRVNYERLGLRLQTWDEWAAAGNLTSVLDSPAR